MDSDHALVRCCLSLRFPGKRVTGCHRIATSQLQKPHIRKEYQNHLSEILPAESLSDLNTRWSTIEGALRDAGTSTCGITENTREKHWISTRQCASLMLAAHCMWLMTIIRNKENFADKLLLVWVTIVRNGGQIKPQKWRKLIKLGIVGNCPSSFVQLARGSLESAK